MGAFPIIDIGGSAFERGIMHVAPDVPSRVEYQPVALRAEPVPA